LGLAIQRPPPGLININLCRKTLEATKGITPRLGIPEPRNFLNRCAMILIGSDWEVRHSLAPQNVLCANTSMTSSHLWYENVNFQSIYLSSDHPVIEGGAPNELQINLAR
jgi:hypothetical protein